MGAVRESDDAYNDVRIEYLTILWEELLDQKIKLHVDLA